MSEHPEPLPDHGDVFFDGGNLDCGSGLVLLIREHMSTVPQDGVLEMRSMEPSVGMDLPPWCRMVGHTLLGSRVEGTATTYYIRKGGTEQARDEQKSLEDDKRKAREYAWRLRTRSSEVLQSTVYCRNFSFVVGQPASFEEQDRHPCAVEYLLGALSGALSTAFATACSRQEITVDDIEISIQGRLKNILSHLGIEHGDPSLDTVDISCYVSSFDDRDAITSLWKDTLEKCPVTSTLKKCVTINTRLNII
jgi:uncharacterized OsmC-like protein/TusA-related sulfurtransferase